ICTGRRAACVSAFTCVSTFLGFSAATSSDQRDDDQPPIGDDSGDSTFHTHRSAVTRMSPQDQERGCRDHASAVHRHRRKKGASNAAAALRSEEHTSELQSLAYL